MDARQRIYMDNHATTPVDPRVLEAMLPYFTEKFGNAASRNHAYGWDAEEGVEHARRQVADAIGANPKEIVFTSGATESDNIAVKGACWMLGKKGKHIITLPTEHKAVLDSCKRMEREGFETTYVPVGPDGLVDVNDIREAIREDTILISVMLANNEIGVIQPIREIGALAREHGIYFHCDAVQGVGKIPIDVNDLNVDIMAISGHKLYGPKGIGALYVRRRNPRVRLAPVIDGGGHERGLRSGTLDVPSIVGLGAAIELATKEMAEEGARMLDLRERLRKGIMDRVDEVKLNGSYEHRLPGNLNLSFAYVEGESLMMGLEGIAVSSGSACTSASLEPSYVLRALGVQDDLAHSSIRFGLGRFNTVEEVDYVADRVVETVNRLREMSPLYEMAQEGIDPAGVEWGPH